MNELTIICVMATPLRVLLLEDNPDDAELLLHELEQVGFLPDTLRAETKAGFLEQLARFHSEIDLILSDHDLPDFDSMQALDLLKERSLDIPFVIISGMISEELAVECMKQGAADYLLKDRLARLGPAVRHALEERQMRLKQQQAEEALRESAAKYRTLFEESKDAIFITDRKGRFVDVNQATFDLFGYSREDLDRLGLTVQEIYVDAADRGRFQQEIEQQGAVRDFEVGLRKQDGTELTCLVTATVRRSDDGALLGYQGIIRDITQQKLYEAGLIRAREEAEAMSRLKSAIVANMSHEVRTPLTAIMGFAAILAQEVPVEYRDHINHIEYNGRRLLDTLNAILNLSTLEAGTVELNVESVNVAEEIREKGALLRPLAEKKGLSLRITHTKPDIYARLDRACLNSILNNLITNAIKFTERGAVSIAVRDIQDRVEIQVSDTGIGISEEFLMHLFEEFKQESTGTTRMYEGIGLGLPVTKKFVELMDGEIAVRSRQGKGSTFTVTFPRQDAEREALAVMPHRSTKPVREPARSPARVLAVDDNPAMLLLMERFLEEVSEVSAVDTSLGEEEALALARRQCYDVVLLDISLGGIRTGEDVLHELRRLSEYEAVPVVAVTAYAMPEDRRRFLKAGFDAYLAKPFTEEQLRDVLIQVLLAPMPFGNDHPRGASIN